LVFNAFEEDEEEADALDLSRLRREAPTRGVRA
jgi:hypothetical protein